MCGDRCYKRRNSTSICCSPLACKSVAVHACADLREAPCASFLYSGGISVRPQHRHNGRNSTFVCGNLAPCVLRVAGTTAKLRKKTGYSFLRIGMVRMRPQRLNDIWNGSRVLNTLLAFIKVTRKCICSIAHISQSKSRPLLDERYMRVHLQSADNSIDGTLIDGALFDCYSIAINSAKMRASTSTPLLRGNDALRAGADFRQCSETSLEYISVLFVHL
mmetsp:Transcript_34405/g.67803  ORF Transcript_34405/g.67803 Transcript_34405/m.67803 type:complete len:219 (+) Transcript_34405:1066-1722(+)